MILTIILLLWGIKKNENSTSLSVDQANILRGIGSIYVLFCHCNMIYQFSGTGRIFLFAYSKAAVLLNGMFFFISGYGIWKSIEKKPNYLSGIGLVKRLMKICIPAGMVYLLYCFWELWNKNIKIYDIVKISNICKWIFCDDVLWFVIELFFCYLVVWGSYKYFNAKTANSIVFFVILLWYIVSVYTGRGVAWNTSTLCFWVGIWIGQNPAMLQKMSLPLRVNLFLLFLVSFYLYCVSKNVIVLVITGNISTILFSLGVFILSSRFIFGNFLSRFLSNIFYEIYLVHMILLKQSLEWHISSDIVRCILVIIGTIAIAICMNVGCKKINVMSKG